MPLPRATRTCIAAIAATTALVAAGGVAAAAPARPSGQGTSGAGAAAHKAPRGTDAWKWLKGTIWVVPPGGVTAFQLLGAGPPTSDIPPTTPPTLVRLQDQTVYEITGYSRGYFWGRIVVALGAPGVATTYTCGTVLSPITPEGNLILSSTLNQAPVVQQWGSGMMVMKGKQWTMQNWKAGGYAHWAYMVQARPNSTIYNKLPFVGISVPDMLAMCPDSAPLVPAS